MTGESPDDFIARLFQEEQEVEDRYPGSRRKRRERIEPVPRAAVGIYGDEPWDSRPKRLVVDGKEHEFFEIGQLAQAINRRPVTIRMWERTGIIPLARYRDKRKRRLYTRRQVEGLVEITKAEGLLDFNVRPEAGSITQNFKNKVLNLWKEPLS